MATVTIGGVSYAVAPYSLYELQLAAPAIDRLRASVALMPDDKDERLAYLRTLPLAETFAMQRCYLDALLPGIQQTAPDATSDSMAKKLSYPESQALPLAWMEVQREAGMIAPAGEPQGVSAPAMTPATNETADPSPINSSGSSASSSQPVVA